GENWMHEWYLGAGTATIFYNGGPKSFHYTNWWPYMGADMYEESNRLVVDYRKVEAIKDPARGTSFGNFYKEGNDVHPRVPYLFCTYTRGDISDGCNTRDYGADQWERMKQHVDNWETYYPLRSFTRYRYGMSPESHIRRNYRRIYRRLKDFNNSYALYQGLFRQWFDESIATGFFTDVNYGWASYTLALNDGFNMAMRTLAMPDIKGYQKTTTPAGHSIYGEAVFVENLKTDLTNGRYFSTAYHSGDFSDACGLTWWECLHHVGFYTDKIMALMALSDSRTYFVGQDTAEDVRTYRISFFDNYTTQMIDFIGSVLGSTYDEHAPLFNASMQNEAYKVDSKGTVWRYGVAWRDYADRTKDPVPSSGTLPVEPATRFTLQMYLMVIGMTNLQTNFDNEFVERSLMWKAGSSTGWDIGTNANVDGTVTFEDPRSGYTYVAANYLDGRGIAQKMIAHANALKVSTSDKAEGTLYDYLSLMDIQTRLTERYRAWATWGWNPFNP
ncbi:MAG: hypothetical protein JRH20_16070, partial [Deltaproteobacteria bacterium]|nr:hypothetical protein [Deltaproteobacteria bacterium]